MKAIVQHQYGAPQDVLHLAEVEVPAAGAQDVLVSERASPASLWDWHFIRGEPFLLRHRLHHAGPRPRRRPVRPGLPAGRDLFPGSDRKVLTPRGRLIQSFGDGGRWLGPVPNLINAVALNALVGQTLKSFTVKVTAGALTEIGGLIESGPIAPVIDLAYLLADAAAAVRLAEEGSPAGRSSSWPNHLRRTCPANPADVPTPERRTHCSPGRVTGGEPEIRSIGAAGSPGAWRRST
jgi:NADPH:quinone reductase-like Zn-dependent oxidoreductase